MVTVKNNREIRYLFDATDDKIGYSRNIYIAGVVNYDDSSILTISFKTIYTGTVYGEILTYSLNMVSAEKQKDEVVPNIINIVNEQSNYVSTITNIVNGTTYTFFENKQITINHFHILYQQNGTIK